MLAIGGENVLKIYTIGVYGKTEDEFFDALVENEIELFIDIRARRGMRGSKYSFRQQCVLAGEAGRAQHWLCTFEATRADG